MWLWSAARARCVGCFVQHLKSEIFYEDPCHKAGIIFLSCRIYMHQTANQAIDGKGQSDMELKVFKDTIAAYGGRWETRLELPVETEILIPDYLPAVFKIVKCLMEPVVLQNRVSGGRWQTEGYLRCTVYYQSDEPGCRLYRTEQKFAFEKTVELPAGAYADGPAQMWGEPEYCNCRAVSEHRIDLRGAYILCGAVSAIKECELLTSLADCGVEQRTRELSGLQRVAAEEKTITAETTILLPDAGDAILDIGGTFALGNVTLQTGQASVQGTLQMQVCYQPADSEELTVRQKEIPVQQTVEIPGASEEDSCVAWGKVTACTLTDSDGTGEANLAVVWKLHLEVWHTATRTVVADAYSTICQTQTVQTACKLLHKTVDLAGTISVVLEDDLPDSDVTVKGCFVTLGAAVPVPIETKEGVSQIRLSGKGTAHVLCADARGELTCYDKPFVWQPEGSWNGVPGDACVSMNASVNRITSSKNNAQLRVELEIQTIGAMMQASAAEALCEVELGEEYADGNDGPALYLYYAREGERVFDIAKRYHARAKDLVAANHLECDGKAPQDLTTETACLLIPAAL